MYYSHSRISKYESCPKQFQYYYINGFRPIKKSVNLVFGSCIHSVIEDILNDHASESLRETEVYVDKFNDLFASEDKKGVEYGKYDNFDKLNNIGSEIILKFIEEELGRFLKVYHTEVKLSFEVFGNEFIGYADCIAQVVTPEGEVVNALIDFKTSRSSYSDEKVILSDQLTAYFHGSKNLYIEGKKDIERVGYVVLQKKKNPEIQWVFSERNEQDFVEYKNKAERYIEFISKGYFHKQPGMNCSWCDFKLICMGGYEDAGKEFIVNLNSGLNLSLGRVNELPISFGSKESGEGQFIVKKGLSPLKAIKSFVDHYNIIGDYIFKVKKEGKKRWNFYYYKLGWEGQLERLYGYEEVLNLDEDNDDLLSDLIDLPF